MTKENQFKPGESGNPKGKKPGTKNYSTIRREAIKRYALERGLTPEDVEFKMAEAAIEKTLDGDYRFYQDDRDRHLGKPQQKVDVTTQGEPISVINYIKPDGGDK